MKVKEAIRHVKMRQGLRSKLAASLINKTCAGQSVFVDRSGFERSEMPYINIQHMPKEQAEGPFAKVEMLIGATLAPAHDARPFVDDCGACIAPVVACAETMELEILETLACVNAKDCGCTVINVEPIGIFIDAEGNSDAATVRFLVSFTYPINN